MYTSTPITKTILSSLFMLTLGLGSIWILSPFLPALVWASMITISTWGLYKGLEKRIHSKGFAITIMIAAMALLVILPIGATAYVIFSRVDDAVAWLKDLPGKQLPPLPASVASIPLFGTKISEKWIEISNMTHESLAEYLRNYSLLAINWMAGAAKSAGLFFVHLLLTLGLVGLFYATGEIAAKGIRMFFVRLAGDRGDRAVILAAQSIKAVAMGIVVTAAIQTAMAGAGFLLAQVPFAGLLTAITFVFCIAQLGAAIPLFGAAGYLFFKDHNLAGSLLLVWALVVTTIDNFLRPILIHRGADLPLILIFAGVLGGLFAFGVVGLFIGPVMLAVTYTLLQSWVLERRIELEDVDDIKPLPTPIRPGGRSLDH